VCKGVCAGIKRCHRYANTQSSATYLRQCGTRQYMKDRLLAEYLNQVEKNRIWEEDINYTSINQKKTGDELWKYIINNATKGRDEVDDLFKLNDLSN